MNLDKGKIIIYQTENEDIKVDVYFEDDTFWMTQKSIVELFQSSKSNISEHLTNIFKEGELEENSVVRIFRTTANDGKNYNIKYYNLDAIIAVGYRVNSVQATRFRQWATQTLKEYIVKGFVLNDDMLKNGKVIKIKHKKTLNSQRNLHIHKIC